MKDGLFLVFDRVAEQAIGPIQQFKLDAVAIRMFSDAAADDRSYICGHLADFDLVCVGEFDPATLAVTPLPLRVVLTGAALAASRSPVVV